MNENQVISRDAYFGKYGPIAKTILTVKNDPDTKISFNQAFITYTNSLDSSLAIAVIIMLYLGSNGLQPQKIQDFSQLWYLQVLCSLYKGYSLQDS